jgi:hypothetical protein
MAHQCLAGHMGTIEEATIAVEAWQAHRNNLNAKENWQFTSDKARIKRKRLYPTLEA